MRLFVGDLADNCAVVILPVGHDDARFLAHPAAAAVGGDQQRRGQLLAIFERDIDAVDAAVTGSDLRRQVQADRLVRLNRLEQKPAKHRIFDHDPHRPLALAGHKVERARFQPVIDQNLFDIAAFRAQLFGQADRIEHLPAGAVDRGYPGIILRIGQIVRVGPVDNSHLKTMSGQRERLGQADHAPSQYDDIAVPRINTHEDRLSEPQIYQLVRHRRR